MQLREGCDGWYYRTWDENNRLLVSQSFQTSEEAQESLKAGKLEMHNPYERWMRRIEARRGGELGATG